MVAVATVIAHAAIGWWLSPRLQDATGVERAACAATIALGTWTLLPNVLGAFGVLRAGAYLIALAALFAVTSFVPSPSPGAGRIESRQPIQAFERALIVLTTTLFGLVAWKHLAYARLLPLGWYGGDDNSYHSAAVALWNHTQDLRMPKFSFGDPSTPFYPIGSELQAWALLAPFRDCDIFMRWSQLPFFVGSVIAVAALTRRLGGSAQTSALAGLLYACIPRFFPDLAFSTGNDCATAFYAIAAIHGALSMRVTRRAAMYPALALGLLAGTKYVGFLFAGPILLVVIAALLDDSRGEWRRAVAPAMVFVGVAFLAGGYTYARNAWVTGNPLFPAHVSIGGVEVLRGWPESSLATRMQSAEAAIDPREFLLGRQRALGRHFPLLLLAACAAPIVALVRRRPLAHSLALLQPLLLFLVFLYLIHDHRDIRYVMAAVGVAAASCAWLVEQLPARATPFVRSAVLLFLAVNLRRAVAHETSDRNMLLAVALAVTAATLLLMRHLSRAHWRIACAVALAVAIMTPLTWTAPIAAYQEGKLTALRNHIPEALVAAQLDRLTRSRGERIAYSGMNRPYVFAGTALQNVVEMVPRTSEAAARYYDWTTNADIPYGEADGHTWLRNVDLLGIRYAVVVNSGVSDAPERRWMLAHPERFTRVIAAREAEVYEVRR